MNKSTQRVRANHTQQPKDQKQNGYSPEHRRSFLLCIPPTATALESTRARLGQVSGKVPTERAMSLYIRRVQTQKGKAASSVDLNDPVPHGIKRKVGDRMQVEFAHQVCTMSFRRLDAEVKGRGNFFGGLSFGH